MKKLLSAAADAGDVPIDVICGILSYLPVKSVLRFRCVSKSWYSLINDSHFKKLHLLRSHDQVLILQLQCSDKYYSFYGGPFFDELISGESTQMESLFTPIPNPPICNRTKVLAACDGLLLVRNCDNYGQLTLLNPSTRERRSLQDVKYCDFTPNGSFYDLGYDSSTDDYKVLLRQTFFRSDRKPWQEINILSVKTNCWRKFNYVGVFGERKNAVNLNGSLNWVHMHCCTPEQVSKGKFKTAKIVSFSLANETITEMEHPCYYNDFTLLDLGVLQGCLCLAVAEGRTPSFTIWLMKEFGATSSWTKVITIPRLGGISVRGVTLLPFNYMNKTIFLIESYSGVGADLLILNDLEAEEDYKIVKITNFPRHYLPHLVTFSRSLISPN
ncbi:F-box protein CPR1-like [Mercurialis annua]|uniref:F-box protein CPR1-like n=1 Tax=Mercurialis annua TaxID=3986 RepID=UPI00215E9890|nr:F-box protein CPR1-like [Mercurialis annua]